jgi:hypothetical protein
MVELLNSILKDGENIIGRVTGLQLRCEWMREEVVLGHCLIGFKGSVENGLEDGRGSESHGGWSLRHRESNTAGLDGVGGQRKGR